MAEYRALAQNTYKFVTERTFNTVGDISTPTAPMFGKMKVIKDGEVLYMALQPRGTTVAGSDNYVKLIMYGYFGDTEYKAAKRILERLLGSQNYDWCVVDGVRHYGVKNNYFNPISFYNISEERYSLVEIENVSSLMLPGGICKVIMYSAAQGTIITSEINFKRSELTAPFIYGSSSQTYNYITLYPDVSIAKEAEDIILGIEIEYPKYDIAFSFKGSNMQYSIDDGRTFQDITDGLVLEQVEHITFKNTDTVTHNIGTVEDSTDLAAMASGETRLIVPEKSGTWYIS